MKKFCVQVFSILISKSLHEFALWHDYRYWSNILFGTILTPAYDPESKVTEIYVKILHQSF